MNFIKALFVLCLALVPGCCMLTSDCSTTHTLQQINKVGFVAANAFILCDTASTIQMSDNGKWDREMGGGILHEQNPLLGSTPSVPVLVGVAAADIGVNTMILYSPRLPDWFKTIWFTTIIGIESAVAVNNARFVGVCGVGAQINPPNGTARVVSLMHGRW